MYHLLGLYPQGLTIPELSDILVHSLPLQQVESVITYQERSVTPFLTSGN